MSFIKKTVFCLLILFTVGVTAFASEIGVVNTDVLNFREGAGTGYKLLGQFVRGEIVHIVRYVNNDWVQVTFNGRTGYVCKNYLSIRSEEVVSRSTVSRKENAIEQSGYVTASSLNLRSSAEFANNIVANVSMYTPIWVVENMQNGWYKVNYNNMTCFASAEYIAIGQAPSAPATGSAKVVNFASSYLGKPYSYGGNGPNSFDCSGFVKFVFSNFGITLNRTASSQLNNGYYVLKNDLQPGDIVFFKQGSTVDHVGIYIGNGKMIHASKPGDVVKYDSISSGYYNNCYYSARRVI